MLHADRTHPNMTGVAAYADLLRKQFKALAVQLSTPRRARCRAGGARSGDRPQPARPAWNDEGPES